MPQTLVPTLSAGEERCAVYPGALQYPDLRAFPRESVYRDLTALYKWRMKYDPSRESYSLRSRDWRYIRYENGMEELDQTDADPYEWDNVADKPEHTERLTYFRTRLQARLPKPGTIPPQPVWKPQDSK